MLMNGNNVTFKMILAMTTNGGIGKNGGMPWKMMSDLMHFKTFTRHCYLVMGRKTFESLPGILPNRMHLVVSSTADPSKNTDSVKWFKNHSELDRYIAIQAASRKVKTVVYMGGSTVYSNHTLINRCDEISITTIDCHVPCDTWVDDHRLTDNRDVISTFEIHKNTCNDYNAFVEIWERK